jgi:hypothetical protein
MCAQCMMTAAAAVGTASGVRAYIGARRPSWLGPTGMRRLTAGLIAAALIASATLVSGSG